MYSENDWRYYKQHTTYQYLDTHLEHKLTLDGIKKGVKNFASGLKNVFTKKKTDTAKTQKTSKKETNSSEKTKETEKKETVQKPAKWEWPDGKNTPEYNHWYYVTHPEKWPALAKNAVDDISRQVDDIIYDLNYAINRKGMDFLDSVDYAYKHTKWWDDAMEKKTEDLYKLADKYESGDEKGFIKGLEKHYSKTKETEERGRLESEKSTGEVDKATGWPMQTANNKPTYDLARVNQDNDNWSSNTKRNCFLCTCTYDLRQRGYDVEANTAGVGYYTQDYLPILYPGAEVKSLNLKDQDSYDYNTGKYLPSGKEVVNKKTTNTIEQKASVFISELEKYPEGSRGYLGVQWSVGGGHAMAWEIRDGNLIILDGQVNKVYTNPMDILKITTGNYNYARLDNQEPDPRAIKRVAKAYGT